MALRDFLRGWLKKRTPHRAVELDPLDQHILVALLRSPELPFRSIHAWVEPESRATPAQTVLALAKLEGEALIIRVEHSSESMPQTAYCLMRQGRKIARLLPPGRRSRIDVRL